MTTLAAILLTCAALVAIILPLARRRPLTAVGPNGPGPWEERYRGALADLQDLEMDWQLGNLSDDDYTALRETQRRRAAEALRQRDVREVERAHVRARIENDLTLSLASPPAADGQGGGARVLDHSTGRALPRPKVALVAGSGIALVAVVGVVALYIRLADVQAQQAPTAALPLAHAHTAMIDGVGEYWVGHHDGLLRSGDARSWQPAGLVGDVMALVTSADGSRRVALGHDVLAASTDDGVTWSGVAHDLPGTDIHGAAMGNSGIYAYVVGAGVFRSRDGVHWEATGPPVAQDVSTLAVLPGAGGGDVLFLAAGGTLARSADGGRTWAPAAGAANLALAGLVHTVAAEPGRGVLYAGTTQGLFRSTSSGAEWTKLPFRGAPIAIGARGDRVVVADDRGQFFVSTDSGGTWTP